MSGGAGAPRSGDATREGGRRPTGDAKHALLVRGGSRMSGGAGAPHSGDATRERGGQPTSDAKHAVGVKGGCETERVVAQGTPGPAPHQVRRAGVR